MRALWRRSANIFIEGSLRFCFGFSIISYCRPNEEESDLDTVFWSFALRYADEMKKGEGGERCANELLLSRDAAVVCVIGEPFCRSLLLAGGQDPGYISYFEVHVSP